MYKQAAQLKLRFATSRGSLSTEQLYDLPISELDTLAISHGSASHSVNFAKLALSYVVELDK